MPALSPTRAANSDIPPSAASKSHIGELDGIRGLAALLVLVHHYFTGIFAFTLTGTVYVVDRLLHTFFLSGVDLFYVLSGFLVGGIIIDRHRTRGFLKVFFIRRICRIFPVYFALMASFVTAMLLIPRGTAFFDQWLLADRLTIWPYLTFLQSYTMGLENMSGPKWVGISWSVSVEEQFYLLTPLLFLLAGRRIALAFAVSVVTLAPYIRHELFDNVGFYAGYMFFPGRLDSIMWGVLLAFALRSDRTRRILRRVTPLMYLLAAGAFAVVSATLLQKLVIHPTWMFTLLAVMYTVLMWAVLEGKLRPLGWVLRTRPLGYIGAISYGMYMYHQLVNGLVHGVIFGTGPVIDSWARVGATCISVVLVIALAHVSLKYFENPIRRFGHRYKYERTTDVPPTPTRPSAPEDLGGPTQERERLGGALVG